MEEKTYFDNPYPEYNNEEFTFLSLDDTICDDFKEKMKKYSKNMFEFLVTKWKDKVFYDGTVYTGSAGLALYLFTHYLNSQPKTPKHLKMAIYYIDLVRLKNKRISFMCGDAGPLALATVLSYHLGEDKPEDFPAYTDLAERLMSLHRLLKVSPNEILYGSAGYLYALLFVNEHTNGNVIPADHIKKVVQYTIEAGKQCAATYKSKSPLVWHWHDKIYLGGAHGMAGILYMLLQAEKYIDKSDLTKLIKPSIDYLLTLRYSSGNFPSSVNSSSGDRLVQWCHGAPGFVPLLLAAYKIFDHDKYLKIALTCGNVVWERGLTAKGYSLCHGVSGNAYTFIQLYQVTKNPVHLYRACCFLDWCMHAAPGSQRHAPDRPASLFEGLLGRVTLAQDLLHVHDAKFPAYSLKPNKASILLT